MCRKLMSLFCFILALWLAAGAAVAEPLQQDPGPDGIVCAEAEHFDDNVPDGTHFWEFNTDPTGFSGDGFMRALPDGTGSGNPWLYYEVNFVKTGIHYVWVRGYSTSGEDDSCHVGLDGDETTSDAIQAGSGNSTWQWSIDRRDNQGLAQVNVTSVGVHTLHVRMREDGWRFDKIVLTINANYTPTGNGPPESIRISPGAVSNPDPANLATDVPRDVVLTWTPGEFAPAVNGHIVYLSESFSDVNDGIGGTTVSSASYAPPQRLEFGTTYYWRVDEVNAPPDSTVFRGSVWSFATEPVGYPIDGATITATASSSAGPDFGPENTVNGSGLDASDLHSVEPMAMWLSGDEPAGAWIQYELDQVYKLHQMLVWNGNQAFEALFGFGFKDVTVEYSTDGVAWTALTDVPQFIKAPGKGGYAHDTTVDFAGAAAKYVKLTATSNWGGILPQYNLSEVRFFYIPVVAAEPSPDAGASNVSVDTTLVWRAGREAGTHNLYLSTDEQTVTDATAPAVSLIEASYSPALDLSNKYYWRVDEVNEAETPAVWQGDVWSFSTADSLVVDDFESYNDIDPPDPASHRIFESWSDGFDVATNGALVGNDFPPYMERMIVHGGGQSMPLFYSNTAGATYSEATRTFAAPQDWTRYGVQTLTLYFYGDASNTGQLYLKVNGVKVAYDGDPTDIAKPLWNHWSIELAPLGVNLTNITSLAIGIDGNGAAGTLYVDDIGLALGFAATGPSSSSILFVSSLEADHMPGDNAIKAFFERLGHAVTYIDDNADEASTEAKAAAADLVYISESVGSGDIRDEITEIETPIIVAEPYAWDEMGLTTGSPQAVNQVPASVNITIVGVGHPMAAGYSGDVPVFTALSGSDALIPVGTTGGGAVVIARASGETQMDADVYFVYDKGATLASAPTDGSAQVAAEIRIGFFAASPTAETLLSAQGYDLLRAAVNYALGLAN